MAKQMAQSNTDPGFDRRKRKQGIDYATEIPFHAVPQAGFHATGPEESPITTIGTSKIALNKDTEHY